MKKLISLVVFVLFLSAVVFAEEGTENSKIIEEYTKVYSEEISDSLNASGTESITMVMPKFSVEGLLKKATSGEPLFSVGALISKVLELLLGEVQRTLKLLIFVPAISILGTMVSAIKGSFSSKGASDAAFFAIYVVLAGILGTAFLETVKCGQTAIENIALFMRGIVPVSLASLAAGGAVISATTFEIVLMSVIEITELLTEKIFLPLVMISAALNIANNLSSSINAEGVVGLLNKAVKWGMGIVMTVFVGVTGLQGIASGSLDGLSVKVTKFATSNLIPMVGGILAETVETVMNCSVVIKNAVGVVGIMTVVLISVLPILKVSACLLIFRVCAATVELLSDKRLAKCITGFGDSVSTVLGMTCAVSVMFVIILTIIINIGNTAILFGR